MGKLEGLRLESGVQWGNTEDSGPPHWGFVLKSKVEVDKMGQGWGSGEGEHRIEGSCYTWEVWVRPINSKWKR